MVFQSFGIEYSEKLWETSVRNARELWMNEWCNDGKMRKREREFGERKLPMEKPQRTKGVTCQVTCLCFFHFWKQSKGEKKEKNNNKNNIETMPVNRLLSPTLLFYRSFVHAFSGFASWNNGLLWTHWTGIQYWHTAAKYIRFKRQWPDTAFIHSFI